MRSCLDGAALKKILVLGGTGFVGQSLCEQLVSRHGGAGPRIVVPTRQLQRGRRVQFLPTVDVIPADVNRDADLDRVLAGSDAVVNLIARLHGSEAEFQRIPWNEPIPWSRYRKEVQAAREKYSPIWGAWTRRICACGSCMSRS